VLPAFARDVDFHDVHPISTYLDCQTGDVEYVFTRDGCSEFGVPFEDNKKARQRMANDPDRFLLMPGLSHAEHHQLLQEFLASDWTQDRDEKAIVEDIYARFMSIGAWKERVEEGVFELYRDFVAERSKDTLAELLRERGIETVWK
jgi:hypothetical protein